MLKRGFTLIELIVVIAIIAILAAIIAPNAFKAVEKAKVSGAIEDFRSIKTGAMAYYSDVGTWPSNCTSASTCSAGYVATDNQAGWDGPYLEKWPAQGKWGGNYTYTNNPSGSGWNSTPAGERFVNITIVPASTAEKVDLQMDGIKNNTRGDVRYPSTTGNQNVGVIVSRDGSID
jgi:general secretion pathway protein G